MRPYARSWRIAYLELTYWPDYVADPDKVDSLNRNQFIWNGMDKIR